jgi:hypothetical protein
MIFLSYFRSRGRKAVVLSFLLLPLCACRFALALDPATATFTNTPGEAEAYISSASLVGGQPLLLTNCVLLTTSGSTQNLNAVSVQVKIGLASSNLAWSASATGSTWWALIIVPTNFSDGSIETLYSAGAVTNIPPLKLYKMRRPF